MNKHPAAQVLRFSEVSRSTWYYRKRIKVDIADATPKGGRPIPGYTVNFDGTIIPDRSIVAALKQYRSRDEFVNGGGYQKLRYYLRRDFGYYVNHKKLYRLCKENDLLLLRRKKKIKSHRRVSCNRVIDKPNKLWQFDIKYGFIHGENRFFFVLAFLDVFDRRVVDYHVGLTCKATELVMTLEGALRKAGKDVVDLMIRSDNGPQMTSNVLRRHLENLEAELSHEFIPPATPNKNAHVESFFSIFETEFLQVKYFKDFKSAYIDSVKFIEFYNNSRIHGSLGNLPPTEAHDKLLSGELKIKSVRV